LRAQYGLELEDIRLRYEDAIRTGQTSSFVRWSTRQLLKISGSSEVREAKWTPLILEAMGDSITQLEHATIAEHAYMHEKGLLQAEVSRFRELASLLQQCFDLLYNSLCSKSGSRIGMRELLIASYEVDIAGGAAVNNLRNQSLPLYDHPHAPQTARTVGRAFLEDLNDSHHPLRLEIALNTMLDALPKLEDAVFWTMEVDAWGPILVRHGMEDSATKLAAALNERRTDVLRQSVARTTLSPPPQEPVDQHTDSDSTPHAKVPIVSSIEEDMEESMDEMEASMEESDHPESDTRMPRESEAEWIPNANDSDYSYTNATDTSMSEQGPSFTQLFKPKPETRMPLKMTTANARRRFTSRSNGGFPVGTPSTNADSFSSAAPTPYLPVKRAPGTVGRSRRGHVVGKMREVEEASEDEEESGDEAASGGEAMTGDGEISGAGGGEISEDEDMPDGEESSDDEDANGDEEMSESE
jgi:hypothetical protein